MTAHNRTPQHQVLTEYGLMHRTLDRLEAQQDWATQQQERHEQHSAWLLARIEEAQRLARQMIEASHEVQ